MPVTDLETATVQIPGPDLHIQAYCAQPQANGSYPAVIVFQEIFGVNHHIRDVTERIAREGYVAIAPALYQRLAPGFEAGYTPADIEIGRTYKNQTRAAELLNDTQAAIAFLSRQPQVNADRIGCIGFCFGGHVAYLAATLPQIRATASFYGAGIATFTPGGGPPTLTRTPDIQGRLFAFFGEQDASIPAPEVTQIEVALAQANPRHQVFRYPAAAHGFFCDQRASYQVAAAQDAWQQVLKLFQQELKQT